MRPRIVSRRGKCEWIQLLTQAVVSSSRSVLNSWNSYLISRGDKSAHLRISRPLKRALLLDWIAILGWRAARLPQAILFHAFSVMKASNPRSRP